ncbi:putative ribonuclease H-like domain-containing protein [Tanacetum coccineum]
MDFKEKRSVSLDKSKIECYNYHRKGHFARECGSGRNQGKRSYGDNGRSNAPTNESSSQALVAQDGLGGYDWSNDFEIEPVNYALMVISSSSSSSSPDNEVQKCSKQCLESFKTLQKNYDSEREKHSRARLEIQGFTMEVVKERDELKLKIEKWEESSKNLDELLNSQMSARDKTGLGYSTQLNEMSNNSETDSEISLSVFDVRSSDEESTPANDRSSKADRYHAVPPPITGNFLTPRADISFADDEDDVSEVQTVSPVKTNETQTVKTRVDKIVQTSQKQGIGFKKIKACFVCKSTDHLIKDCNFHDKQSLEPKMKTVVNTGPRVDKPIWDNSKRQNGKRAVHKVSTARLVSTARPVSTVRPRGSYSPIKRSYYTKPAFRPKDLKQDVKNLWGSKYDYCWDRRLVVILGNPEILLQDHAVVDSGCSSHMTGNKAYLSDYEDYNGGFVAFRSDPKGGCKYHLISKTTTEIFDIGSNQMDDDDDNDAVEFIPPFEVDPNIYEFIPSLACV